MSAIRNFVLAAGAVGLAWLLWRIDGAIGDQALLLVFGIVIGLACITCVAVILAAIRGATHDDRPEIAPQAPQWAPPVIVMLGDGTRHGERPYSAPAALLAPPPAASAPGLRYGDAPIYQPAPYRVVSEHEEYVFEDWIVP